MRPLSDAASQRQNVIGVRPLLATLREIQNERFDLAAEAEGLFTSLRKALLDRGTLERNLFEQRIERFVSIKASLDRQVPLQSEVVDNVRVSVTRSIITSIRLKS